MKTVALVLLLIGVCHGYGRYQPKSGKLIEIHVQTFKLKVTKIIQINSKSYQLPSHKKVNLKTLSALF